MRRREFVRALGGGREVVDNILHMMGKTAVEGGYDGYASCPLTTAVGKTILAEFIYGGKVTPTLPLNPAKEHWVGWWIKVIGLPLILELYVEGARVVPEAQHRLQGRCRLTAGKLHRHSHRGAAVAARARRRG